MNELSEFFSSVAKEKKRVEEERIRFTPRVNVDLSDLSSFFGTITEAKREHVVIAKRDSTKLDALKGFFDRLDKFETALQENIDKQKDEPKDGFDPAEVEGYEEFNKKYDKFCDLIQKLTKNDKISINNFRKMKKSERDSYFKSLKFLPSSSKIISF